MSKSPEQTAIEKHSESGGTSATEDATKAALETRVQPTGIRAAVEKFRAVDEDAQVIWKTKGARGTSTTELAGVLVRLSDDAAPSIVIVQELASGKYRLFAETSFDALNS